MPYLVTFPNGSRQPKLPPSLSVDRLSGPRPLRPYRLRGLGDAVNPSFGITSDSTPGLTDTTLNTSTPDADSNPVSFDPFLATGGIDSWLQNALTGTLSTAQANALAQNEQAGLIQAGMPAAQAAKQAQSDVHTVLKLNNADPSQKWSWENLSTLEKGLIIGGGALAALLIVVAVKR